LFSIVQRTREIFDLDAPVADIAAVLKRDPMLKVHLRANPGIRVPGAWDGFELTIRAILGQQISVKAATTLAGRIASRYGKPINAALVDANGDDALTVTFPTPERLMRARCNNMGLVGSRAESIRRVARAVVNGFLSFDPSQDPAEFCENLTAIRGIGDWTAQYVAMRALKNPDAFPASDLGLLRALDGNGRGRMRPAELTENSEGWRPWRAYAALLLWSSAAGSGG
jgi:AraC family transcriptional regulator of adaptative response / DNA-3-methyladenine glycosylase II